MGLLAHAKALQLQKQFERLQAESDKQKLQQKQLKNGTYQGKDTTNGTDIIQCDGDDAVDGFRLITNKPMNIGDRVSMRPSQGGLQRADAKRVSAKKTPVEIVKVRYPIKILYIKEQPAVFEFFVGGDRDTPELIYSLAKAVDGFSIFPDVAPICKIENTGLDLDDWIVSISVDYRNVSNNAGVASYYAFDYKAFVATITTDRKKEYSDIRRGLQSPTNIAPLGRGAYISGIAYPFKETSYVNNAGETRTFKGFLSGTNFSQNQFGQPLRTSLASPLFVPKLAEAIERSADFEGAYGAGYNTTGFAYIGEFTGSFSGRAIDTAQIVANAVSPIFNTDFSWGSNTLNIPFAGGKTPQPRRSGEFNNYRLIVYDYDYLEDPAPYGDAPFYQAIKTEVLSRPLRPDYDPNIFDIKGKTLYISTDSTVISEIEQSSKETHNNPQLFVADIDFISQGSGFPCNAFVTYPYFLQEQIEIKYSVPTLLGGIINLDRTSESYVLDSPTLYHDIANATNTEIITQITNPTGKRHNIQVPRTTKKLEYYVAPFPPIYEMLLTNGTITFASKIVFTAKNVTVGANIERRVDEERYFVAINKSNTETLIVQKSVDIATYSRWENLLRRQSRTSTINRSVFTVSTGNTFTVFRPLNLISYSQGANGYGVSISAFEIVANRFGEKLSQYIAMKNTVLNSENDFGDKSIWLTLQEAKNVLNTPNYLQFLIDNNPLIGVYGVSNLYFGGTVYGDINSSVARRSVFPTLLENTFTVTQPLIIDNWQAMVNTNGDYTYVFAYGVNIFAFECVQSTFGSGGKLYIALQNTTLKSINDFNDPTTWQTLEAFYLEFGVSNGLSFVNKNNIDTTFEFLHLENSLIKKEGLDKAFSSTYQFDATYNLSLADSSLELDLFPSRDIEGLTVIAQSYFVD